MAGKGSAFADAGARGSILTAAGGVAAGVALGALVPAPFGAALAAGVLGAALLGAMLTLDRRRAQDAEALARNVGELNIRLAATRVKLDGLQARVDSEPLREADIAPTRASLTELTAEVGILGGVLRDVATTVAEHQQKIDAARQPETLPPPAPVNDTAPVNDIAPFVAGAAPLSAEPAARVDAELKRRDEARLAEILDAFAKGGVEIQLQPITALPQRRTVGYEVLARLRLPDGALLMPAEFLAALERAGQGAALDAQVLTRALAVAGHLNGKAADHFLSINLTATTWGDARALQSVSRILQAYEAQAARLIIETPQRLYRGLDPTRLGLIGAMAARGARFAMDQVSDLRIDPAALAERGFRYVKVPASLLDAMSERMAGTDIDAADLAALMRRFGVELIGERAELDRQVADFIDFDIRLAQGYAISEPRPVRPEVFQPAAAAEPAARAAAQPAPQPEPAGVVEMAPRPAPPAADRVPFRATLRRASA